MIFSYPVIDGIIDIDGDGVNVLVIENQCVFRNIIRELYNQIFDGVGSACISSNGDILNFSSKCEIIDTFIPFNFNTKSIIGKITKNIESNIRDSYFTESEELIKNLLDLFYMASDGMGDDISFAKANISSVLKAFGLEINYEYEEDILQSILRYVELVYTYDCEKLFVLVNVRSYLTDEETSQLYQEFINRGYYVLLIESIAHNILPLEKRIIIDSDMCQI